MWLASSHLHVHCTLHVLCYIVNVVAVIYHRPSNIQFARTIEECRQSSSIVYLWDGCIEARYFQVRVGGRRTVALHSNQPWRRELALALGEDMLQMVILINKEGSLGIRQALSLTVPMGMPRDLRSSSDRSPGFFSFSRVSNSLPWCVHRMLHVHMCEGEMGWSVKAKRCISYLIVQSSKYTNPPHSTGLHGWTSWALSATCRSDMRSSGLKMMYMTHKHVPSPIPEWSGNETSHPWSWTWWVPVKMTQMIIFLL